VEFLCLLLGKSPLLSRSYGAMTAILLIFKDTILGFVASIQMSVYDMVRVETGLPCRMMLMDL
jgi:miniconductance mechanosensitive channel